MRTRFACVLTLILAVTAGAAWAGEKTGTVGTPAAPAPQTGQTAPAASPGNADIQRQQDRLDQNIKHLDDSTQLRIKGLEKQIEAQDKQIDRFLSWAEWWGIVASAFGILVTIGLGVFGVMTYISARDRAADAADNWMKEHGQGALEPLIKEAQEFFDETKRNAEQELREIVKNAREKGAELDDILNGISTSLAEGEKPKISASDKEEIERAAQEAKSKEISQRTFRDWEAQAYAAYIDQDFEGAAGALDAAAKLKGVPATQMARILLNKGVVLVEAGNLEEGLATFEEVEKWFGDSKKTAFLELASLALNNKGFVRLRLAKKEWKTPEKENEAREILTRALADFEASLEKKPDEPVIFGNKGYVLFLLGRVEEAEPVLRHALKLGGKKQYKLELEDAEYHPLPQDEAFKALINRLWDEVAAEVADRDGKDGEPKG